MSGPVVKSLQFDFLDGPGVVSIDVPAAVHRRGREIESLGGRLCIAQGRGRRRRGWSLQVRGPRDDLVVASVDSDARGGTLSASIAGLLSYAHAVLCDPLPW